MIQALSLSSLLIFSRGSVPDALGTAGLSSADTPPKNGCCLLVKNGCCIGQSRGRLPESYPCPSSTYVSIRCRQHRKPKGVPGRAKKKKKKKTGRQGAPRRGESPNGCVANGETSNQHQHRRQHQPNLAHQPPGPTPTLIPEPLPPSQNYRPFIV